MTIDSSPAESLTALALLPLIVLHLVGGRIPSLDVIPRSRWLSAAGGISVAYVLVHLLPELGAAQRAVELEGEGPFAFLEDHAYLMALLGLGLFYGVELAARQPSTRHRTSPSLAFWASVASFAVYNALIGYLLVHREDETVGGLVLFTAALGVHFLVNDHALNQRHRASYRQLGRWILIAAIVLGWLVGIATEISEAALGLILAFIAGGVILNVMKEELPRERESRFDAFAVGAVGYAILLQLA